MEAIKKAALDVDGVIIGNQPDNNSVRRKWLYRAIS